MSDASWDRGWAAPAPKADDRERAATAPPRPVPGPVFIGDCATQWGGQPMLLLLADAWARRDAGGTGPET